MSQPLARGPWVLVVDDDEVSRQLLEEVLSREGYRVKLAPSGEAAIELLGRAPFPVVLSDIRMLEADGLAVLKAAKAADSLSSVILMTGFGSLTGALDAVKAGAFDYISKPFRLEELRSLVARAWKHTEELRSGALKKTGASTSADSPVFVGRSAGMVDLYKKVARASQCRVPVLVQGERGSGKRSVVEALHQNGLSSEKMLRWVDGATVDRHGFEELDAETTGSLAVDDLAQLSVEAQLALLRLLAQDRVRVFGVTTADPESSIESGRLRRDLVEQIGVLRLRVPALRERLEDFSDLVSHFLAKHAERSAKRVSHVSDEALQALRSREWPGNLRELENALARAVALAGTEILYPEDFPAAPVPQTVVAAPAGGSLEELEKAHILRVLQEVGYNKSKASEILGIDRATLYRKAQRYGIELKGPREGSGREGGG
jgi:DNA-binding NtrC family response regulator